MIHVWNSIGQHRINAFSVVVSILVALLDFFMKKQRIISGKEIGGIIKKRRRDLGISQQSLADELGVTYQQIQRYENGTNKLNIDNLQAIAGILQIPVTEFFTNLEPELSIPVTTEELKLLKMYRDMKAEGRKLAMQVAKFSANN